MGHGTYSSSERLVRSTSMGYTSKSRDELFTQQRERKAHQEMDSRNIDVRECRDNADHPATTPVQIYLDVTGSMGHIPHQLIKEGLPTLVSTLIQNGFPDVALMFGAIGDHECDRHPLQIAQFESADAELDMWLTRTYLEGGGGGNMGESYALAWYFAANHVATDAFEKRGEKGFVFTIGDEPNLQNYPLSAFKEMMGDNCRAQASTTAAELYAAACEKNHVFHIQINHGRRLAPAWKQLMGDNLLELSDHTQLPSLISETMLKVTGTKYSAAQPAFTPSVEVVAQTESAPSVTSKISL